MTTSNLQVANVGIYLSVASHLATPSSNLNLSLDTSCFKKRQRKEKKRKSISMMQSIYMFAPFVTLSCAFLSFFFLSWKPRFAPRRNVVVTLPPELLHLIGSHLSLQSKACLALSCKHLHRVFGSALEAPELRLPKLMLRTSRIFDSPLQSHMRPQLLVRLENKKWKYCSGCLRLHPTKEFTDNALCSHPVKRLCNMRYINGIVDLCPCTHMTFRDKNRMATYLRDLERPTQTPPRQIPILRKFTPDKRKSSLSHTCSITHLTKVIKLTVLAFLDEDSNLIIETEFDIKSPQSPFFNLSFPFTWKPFSSVDDCLEYAIGETSSTYYYGRDLSREITIIKLTPDPKHPSYWREFCFRSTKSFGDESDVAGPKWSRYAEYQYSKLNDIGI